MAANANSKPRSPSQKPDEAKHRRFIASPTTFFIDRVLDDLKQHGMPEVIRELHQGPLPRDAYYIVLKPVAIDQKKRADRDRAPCPMCTPNRFLKGSLVYFPELQCVSVIGHCCAEHAEDASREYKAKDLLNTQEDYLLSAFPHILRKQQIVRGLLPTSNEARRVFRRFRQFSPDLHRRLRGIVNQQASRLILHEVIGGADASSEMQYIGPVGFRSRGSTSGSSHDIDLGMLTGVTATLSNYDPAVELNDVLRRLELFDFQGTEGDAIDKISAMTFQERRASVANLRAADSSFSKFTRRLDDFLSFFTPSNISALHIYGTHPLNPIPFTATLNIKEKSPLVEFRQEAQHCRIVLGKSLFGVIADWVEVPLKRTERSRQLN